MKRNEEVQLPPSSEVVAALIARRCMEDDTFAQEMKKNPKQAVQALIPTASDLAINVRTVQNSEDTVYVPLPDYASVREFMNHINDDDLMNVSGGEIGFLIAAGLAFVGGSVLGAVGLSVAGAAVSVTTAAIVGAVVIGAGVAGGVLATGAVAGVGVGIAKGAGAEL